MPFNKRLLIIRCTWFAAALLLSASLQSRAQTPLFNCRPNAAGDGWVCEATEPADTNTATGNNRYNSPGAVLPGSTPQPPPPDNGTAPPPAEGEEEENQEEGPGEEEADQSAPSQPEPAPEPQAAPDPPT